jgi:hypothetical protein
MRPGRRLSGRLPIALAPFDVWSRRGQRAACFAPGRSSDKPVNLVSAFRDSFGVPDVILAPKQQVSIDMDDTRGNSLTAILGRGH